MITDTANLLGIDWTGGGEGILRCARTRRKPPGRSSSRDDGSECDGVHRWVKDGHL